MYREEIVISDAITRRVNLEMEQFLENVQKALWFSFADLNFVKGTAFDFLPG